MTKKSKNYFLVFVGITILAFIWRLTALLTRGAFRFDEVFSVHFANYPLRELLSLMVYENNPPLFYLLLHFWLKIINQQSEWLIRLPSLAFGLAGLWMIFYLGKHLFSTKVGLLAAFFAAFSLYQVFISTEIRPYPLVFLLSLLSICFFWQYLEKKKLASLGYLISLILLLYTHLTGWFVFLITNIFFFLKKKTGLGFLKNQNKLKTKSWLILQIIILLILLPWFFLWLPEKNLSDINQSWYFAVPLPSFYFLENFKDLLAPFSHSLINSLLAVSIIIILLVNFIKCSKRGFNIWQCQMDFSPKTILLFLWLFLPLVIYFTLGLYQPVIFLVTASPAFYLLLARGIKNFNLPKKVFILLIIFFFFLLSPSFISLLSYSYQTDKAAEFIQKNEKSGDKILVHVFCEALTFKYYYQGNSPLEGFYPLDDQDSFDLRVIKRNWQKLVDEKNVEKLAISTNGYQRIFLVQYLAYGLDPDLLVFKWFLKNEWRLTKEKYYLPYQIFIFEKID